MNKVTRVSTSVRHLLPGDTLLTGEVVARRPFTQVRSPKGKMYVPLNKDGITITRLWNASTTMNVLREVI